MSIILPDMVDGLLHKRLNLGVALALSLGACLKAPEPGMELVDGCYYAGTRAVIKITGATGTLLIPGDVPSVHVARRKDQSASMAVFSPGFLLVSTSELRTSKMAEFPKAYYMMDPYSSVPTILVPTEAKKLAKLRRGNDC